MRFVLGVQGNVKRIFKSTQPVPGHRRKPEQAPGLVSVGEGTTHDALYWGHAALQSLLFYCGLQLALL